MSSDKKNHFQLGNKTAKAILIEVCVKIKATPKWDTTNISGSVTSQPKFKCICTVPTSLGIELIGNGVGGTKKEAEHQAALDLLPQILTPSEVVELSTGAVIGKKELVADSDPVSDTDDDVMVGEPIGDLKNLCVKHNLECPEYSEAHRAGPGNTNIFTVTCKVLSTVKTGRRLRLKDAKRVAAFRVLREIKSQGYSTAKAEKAKFIITPPVPTQPAVSSPDSTASASSSTKLATNESSVSLDANPLQRSLATIMEQLRNSVRAKSSSTVSVPMDVDVGQSEASSSSSAEPMEVTEQTAESDASMIRNIKRKLEGQHDELATLNKRRYDPFLALKCDMPVKLVTDYANLCNHLDSTDSLDAEFLSSKQFQELVDRQGGSVNVFMKSAADLKMKYTFGPVVQLNGDEKSTCAFLSMNFPIKVDQMTQKNHTVHGIGADRESAKQAAAFEALKFIRLMIFDIDDADVAA